MPVFEGDDPELNFQHEIPKLGVKVWTSLCNGDALPRRADFDPIALPRAILPHVLLIDIEENGARRFRWRLIGTHTTMTLGRDSTGKYIDDVVPPHLYDEFITPLNWIVEHRRPTRLWGRANHTEKEWVPFENFIAPLADDAGRVNMIFGVTLYGKPLKQPG
jgi:hypothetical protein